MDEPGFLDVVKRMHVNSQDVRSQLDPAVVAEQSIAHRVGPSGKQLDRRLESVQSAESPEDEVKGQLNFIQISLLLKENLAEKGADAVTAASKRLQISEDDVRRMVYFTRLPKRLTNK